MNTKWVVAGMVAILLVCEQQTRAEQGNYDIDLSSYLAEADAAPQAEEACETCWGECGCEDPCCPPDWVVFSELMYIRPRKAGVAYAVPVDGAIVPPPTPPIQVGPTALVDPTYEPGFRIGFGRALNDCSTLMTTWSHFESHTTDAITATAPIVLRSLVSHPSTAAAASDYLDAAAGYDLDFDLVDLDFRRIFSAGPQHTLTWFVGARYAGLQQEFDSTFANAGTQTVQTEMNFDGGGIRLGLEGECRDCNTGFLLYSRAAASFVAGKFRGHYFQGQTFDPVVVETTWDAAWAVSMLDLELGVGWTSPCDTVRCTIGYMFSGWYDVVQPGDYIEAVRANGYRALGESLVFDGLTTRVEVRF
jgi:hypothetical protein